MSDTVTVTKHSPAGSYSQGTSEFPDPGLALSPLVGMWHLPVDVSETFLFPSRLPDILIHLFFSVFGEKKLLL